MWPLRHLGAPAAECFRSRRLPDERGGRARSRSVHRQRRHAASSDPSDQALRSSEAATAPPRSIRHFAPAVLSADTTDAASIVPEYLAEVEAVLGRHRACSARVFELLCCFDRRQPTAMWTGSTGVLAKALQALEQGGRRVTRFVPTRR